MKYFAVEHSANIVALESNRTDGHFPSASTCVLFCTEDNPRFFSKFDPVSKECRCVTSRIRITVPLVTQMAEISPGRAVYIPENKIVCKVTGSSQYTHLYTSCA